MSNLSSVPSLGEGKVGVFPDFLSLLQQELKVLSS